MLLNMKRRLSLKKLRTNSSSTVASTNDVEDRVIMVCEDIPSESSQDSGWCWQSSRDRSSGESQKPDGPGGCSANHLQERKLHGALKMEDLTVMADSSYHTGDLFSVPFRELTGCASLLSIDVEFLQCSIFKYWVHIQYVSIYTVYIMFPMLFQASPTYEYLWHVRYGTIPQDINVTVDLWSR